MSRSSRVPSQDRRGIATVCRRGAKNVDCGSLTTHQRESNAIQRHGKFHTIAAGTSYPAWRTPMVRSAGMCPSVSRGASHAVDFLLWPRRLPVEHFLQLTRMKLVQSLKKTVYLP